MAGEVVFSFWEPKGSMPAYVAVCMETWGRHTAGRETVVVDHESLEEHTGAGVLDLEPLKRFPLATQKDAIEGALLARHGGIFLDADTILVGSLDPIIRRLERSEMVLFNRYLGFAAARPAATITVRWLASVRERLAAASAAHPRNPGWGYLGNEIVADIIDEMTDTTAIMRALARFGGTSIRSYRDPVPGSGEELAPLSSRERLRRGVYRRLRNAIFRLSHSKALATLDSRAWGFMAEQVQQTAHASPAPVPAVPGAHGAKGLVARAIAQYERFWFHESIPPERILNASVCVIGLHNSWTPPWYRELSRDAVLAHPCTLSRLLAHLTR